MLLTQNIADYILRLSEPDFGDNITNLKLQKLLYYSQGFHLAMYGTVLFEEPIKAWEHGPVVESIYHQFKKHGANAIDIPEVIDLKMFTKAQKDLLNEVYEVYGQFSAWKLRNMTHEELPWKSTPLSEVIDTSLMKSFFKTLLK